jgi:hypothetical protein
MQRATDSQLRMARERSKRLQLPGRRRRLAQGERHVVGWARN